MRINQRYGSIVAAILWMGVIFYFSSLPDLKSDLPNIWDFIFRKGAHMFEFGVLYALWWRSLIGCRHRIIWAFVITIGYSISDEFHQGFVHGRVASPVDVSIDTVGMLIAYILLKYKTAPTNVGAVSK